MELVRIVEHQATLSSYRATQNEDRAVQLELLIEATKPKNIHLEWHTLIATPFRYHPPHPLARFRPPYGRNVFYGSLAEETALFEHAFHFMRQRIHLPMETETGMRTLFHVAANDKGCVNIKDEKNSAVIMDKQDYTASHQFIKAHPQATFIRYPSCRDPKQGENAAILDILHLEKEPKWEGAIKFFYDNKKQQIKWLDHHLHIQWSQVC